MSQNKKPLKKIQLQVLSELMKNARISDRELARKLGVSQPTVSRIRYRLEKEGFIRRYTVLPNLQKLGYELVALTFVRFREDLPPKEAEELRKRAQEVFREESFAPNVIMFERGMGLGYTGIIVSYHENYASYAQFMKKIREYEILDSDVKSFLLDLNDPIHYRTLSFTPLAHHLLALKKEKGSE